ncbi:type II toxin-antitoxin system HigB family toxin [Erwinia sp. 198]|uniref:type II toxin-antitoxin system HigB family toxin n=1 Tax=Erwinia sp. 198 TaxID=2022746 RepID=UPI0013157EBE|nr:type II toxin-antitoxin system HigB family toxin [Erwinia sp. 198]
MKIIAVAPLREFWPPTIRPPKAWVDEVRKAAWRTPQDIKRRYPSADLVAAGAPSDYGIGCGKLLPR